MSDLASLREVSPPWAGPEAETEAAPQPWLPPEAPLAMPRQHLDSLDASDVQPQQGPPPATSPRHIALRRWAVFGGALALTALVAVGPWILYGRGGFDGLETLGFAVFLVLASAIACWFCTAVAGYFVLRTGCEQDDLAFAPHPPPPTTRTALLMPLYNEDAGAAFARLAALDQSLARLGVSEAFDIFVLSDSRKAEVVLAERAAFRVLRPAAHSRLYLRRRTDNVERKAGNVGDWVRRFGGAYEFMVVLDADSTMAGDTLLRLVDAMERHPGVGLIQTAPTITRAGTLFARMSQFGVRMYGRVAAAGLAWWAGSEASYWGHNAIVRTEAFASSAGLPILQGEKPFGGHVLSHDVVEAALLRRGGWAVHVTAALDGSCEETPPTLLDFLQRDQRWCQGNLQHLGLLNAPGLHPLSRAQLVMGAMAYLSSPLWFMGLAIGLILQLRYPVDWSTFWYVLHPSFTPFMLTSLLSGLLLIGPKLLGCLLVLNRPGERRAFGGAGAVLKSMGLEILLSGALAPVMMVANTRAVFLTLRGRDVGWRPQRRDADGLAWGDALKAMRWQMLAGLAFCAGLAVRPDLAVCFAPIVVPLLLAAPLAVLTSRLSLGQAAARAGYLTTPDDHGMSATPVVFRAPTRLTPAPQAPKTVTNLG
ncbi:glucans biosynthesis glucosyltransferase MdoH [Phenylobacterium sp.]|uniref:glucans biosynthesis glucosyltransferase MdoH n=1 Tax=Phenylobacterium sp. TaxID=1871053 RepID=UPI0012008DC1|nr:glucans biosynthesis glucosyltransferase MdoH [Phenylobacterium sp.]THD58503.1 MAG: glucans biosynthesis glucosyltransferase MdoH [Phenylobacterium sp.]